MFPPQRGTANALEDLRGETSIAELCRKEGRPDSMYCALAVWSLLAFYSFLESRSVPRLLVSTGLLICAFYAKQTASMFLPLLCTAGLLLLRTTEQRLKSLLGAMGIAAMSAILASPHYWQNAIVSVSDANDLVWAVKYSYRDMLGVEGIVLSTWLACLLMLVVERKHKWLIPTAIVGIYALAVGTATSVKFGSAVNYFDEFLIAAIMLVAASLPAIASAWIGPRIVALGFASTLLCSYIALLIHVQVGPNLYQPSLRMNDPNLMAIQRYFAAKSSSVLVADLADNGFPVFLPTRVAFATFDLTGAAAAAGHFYLAEVHGAIRSGVICYAVTRRAWATDTGKDYESSFPYWATWAPASLRVLLPQFEWQADFGDLVLLHNPVCLAS